MKALDLSIDENDPHDGPATREQIILMSVLEELIAEDAERARGGTPQTREKRRAEKLGAAAPDLKARHVEGQRRAIVTADEADRRLVQAQRHPRTLR
jgi:hypothetical protein